MGLKLPTTVTEWGAAWLFSDGSYFVANTTFLLMYDEHIYDAANYTLAIIMCRNRTVQDALPNYLNVNGRLICAVTMCVENWMQ